MFDFYLKPENKQHLDEICHAARRQAGLMDEATIQRYTEEALRLHPAVAGSARRANQDVTVSGGVTVKAGQLVWIDAMAVNRDESVFAHANQVDTKRNPGLYSMNERMSNLASRELASFSLGSFQTEADSVFCVL